MHISLDSALGQQRRLNQVGETISSIAAPTAAYSLRSLTGGDPKVVRVRRESDNHEQDFTASDVSSGALVDFVNAQVTAPLDIQELTATGRDGDFLIAKAAYSLRSLGTRQATVAATGDTVARADGKYVCQVRRSSDDALKSFTADEITDGTLLSFVGTSGSDNGFVKTWYDQSVTTQAGDTATGNHATQSTAANQPKIVSAGSLVSGGLEFDGSDDFFNLTSSITQSGAFSYFFALDGLIDAPKTLVGTSGGATPRVRCESSNLEIKSSATEINYSTSAWTANSGKSLVSFNRNGSNSASSHRDGVEIGTAGSMSGNLTHDRLFKLDDANAANFTGKCQEVIIYNTDQTDNRTAIEANIGEVYSIDLPSGVDPGFDQVNGFVETWYDQSGNGNDATQATAGSQPKIVDAGSLLTAITFDGSDDNMDTSHVLGATSTIFGVCQSNAASDILLDMRDSGTDGAFVLSHTSNSFKTRYNSTDLSGTSGASGLKLGSFLLKDGTQEIRVNGTSVGSGTASGTISVTATTQIGGRSFSTAASSVWDGSMSEIIIYNSDQSANQTALETNINNHYSIF